MSAFFRSWHFIALMAVLSGLSALSIDAILPAFPELTAAFALPPEEENRIQNMVFAFMLGFAMMQFVFGILTDIFGRKKLVCIGIIIFILASASTFFISGFEWLLFARFMQGVGVAAPRVISMAITRDVMSGKEMSRTLSFITMVFLMIPVFAPSIGQLVLKLGDWHSIFWLFIVIGLALLAWVGISLPETLPREARRPFRLQSLKDALLEVARHPPTVIAILMQGMMFSMMMSYISQAEQIFQRDVYALGDWFPVVFALATSGMFAASLLNARLVMKVGMRRVIRIALIAMVCVDALLFIATFANAGKPPLAFFLVLLIAHLFCFSLTMPNLTSLILEPHQHIAGTVSALIGSLMSIIGIGIAHVVAAQFNGTLHTFASAYFAIAASALFAFYWLNRPQHLPRKT